MSRRPEGTGNRPFQPSGGGLLRTAVGLLLLSLTACSGPAPRLAPVLKEALAHNRQGIEAQNRGEVAVAVREFSEALRLHASVEDQPGMIVALINLARLNRRQGLLPQAAAEIDQALTQLSETDALFSEAAFEKALVLLADGSLEEAGRWAQRVGEGERADQRGRRLNLLGRILLLQGDGGKGEGVVRQALALNESQDDPAETANSQRLLGQSALLGNRPEQAVDRFAQALTLDKAAGLSPKIALDLQGLASAAQLRGEVGETIDFLRRAYAVSLNGNDRAGASQSLQRLIELYRASGENQLAATAAGELERLRAGVGKTP